MNIAVIGASIDRAKFGNKAVRAYKERGSKVFPVNPKEKEIEGLKCFNSLKEINEQIDFASIYLPPKIGLTIVSDLKEKRIKKVYLNPGTESDELIKALNKAGIIPILECSILALGRNPEKILI